MRGDRGVESSAVKRKTLTGRRRVEERGDVRGSDLVRNRAEASRASWK
jgi:hypothetical protein